MEILFFISLFLIVYSFVGYPLSLIILNKIGRERHLNIKNDYEPTVTVIIPAHNEESVIEKKLQNLIKLSYSSEKIDVIIASDNSTDKTNKIVESFINNHKDKSIKLYEVKERKGKTNAQNEAVKQARGEIIVFSDANSMLDKNSIKELVKFMSDNNVAYVTGKLQYTNEESSNSSSTESNYWNYDLFMRYVESKFGSVTAGNGAIYAVRKSNYVYCNPIKCHDSEMPIEAVLMKKRAVYNPLAIAYEKAGETTEDEFKRKVRMSRDILDVHYDKLNKYNIFKYGWFSYFHFCHRYLRNSLFILHIILFISNLFIMKDNIIFFILGIGQILFYLTALIYYVFKLNNKYLYIIYYYVLTIYAQLVGSTKQITGKSKPFWEKAESTR